MPSRRSLLRGAVAAAAAGPLVYLAGNRIASAAARLPLTIVNNTGKYANTAIWLYVVGTDLATGRQAYVRSDGTLVPVSAALNGADGYADLSIPLAASGTTTINLPNMSGRVYFSITDKLKFKVVTDGAGSAALQYPAGWVASDPSYPVLHDCVEFTFNGSGMFCNTTMVDMFSIPLAISLTGAANQTTGTLVNGGRDAIFAGVAAQPDFSRLVIGDLRVLAPGHGIDAGLFSPTYYDGYVNDVWTRYAGTDLSVNIAGTTYTGRVSGNAMVWSGGVATINKPTTRDIFYCAGALAAPNDGKTGPVAAQLGAAFNRSTLLAYASQPVNDPALYYAQATTNHYAQVIHQNTVDGKAYGFPFDDVGNFASYIQDTAPTSMTVTLTPFGAGSAGTGGGAVLLSANRTATASSVENASFPAGNAVDGNTATRWSSQFADPQWLSVDLGAVHSISRVALTWEAAYASAYQVQTSTDGSTWTTAYATSAGDGGVDDLSFPAVSGRYVRVYGTRRATAWGYSLWELAVYGS